MVFARHQHESAIGIHVYPPPESLLPPPSSPYPSRLSQGTGFGIPMSYIKFHWLSVLHMVVYKFQCYSLKSLQPSPSSTDSVSPWLPWMFTIAMIWKQLRCPPADKCIRNLLYIHNGVLVIKTNTFDSLLMSQMNLEPIIQSEVSLKEKDKYCILTQLYGI